ncbi:MAG TPA: dephospho-CoA kinase [Flavobacterium sp.]|nr:dephospho-CoA kinase [Flavobacterium sp.]
MTKIIGLTGGIGSGKTTVAAYFQSWGVPVYIADDAAKSVMEQPAIVTQIRSIFGETIFDYGQLNRKKLADIVFANPQLLKQLNAVIHPAVGEHFRNWITKYHKEPFVIKEAAILFESGSYQDCDAIITVTAPIELRIERVMDRDKSTREEILKRIENQWDDARKIANSDYVIHNITPADTLRQTREIFDNLHNSTLN